MPVGLVDCYMQALTLDLQMRIVSEMRPAIAICLNK